MAEDKAKARSHDLTEAEEAMRDDEAREPEVVPEKKKAALPEFQVSEIAVVTTQEELDAVVKSHQGWIASVFDPKAETVAGRANLKGCDLRAFVLEGVNLSGANLEGANLQGVEATGINLTAANLRGALLQAANLRSARLTRAKIDGADLRGADLTGATLLGVDLSKAITKSPEAKADAQTDRAGAANGSAASAATKGAADASNGANAGTAPRRLDGATRAGPDDEQWDDDANDAPGGDARAESSDARGESPESLPEPGASERPRLPDL